MLTVYVPDNFEKMNEFEIQVDKESEGIRLDTFKNSFPDISRASIQKSNSWWLMQN